MVRGIGLSVKRNNKILLGLLFGVLIIFSSQLIYQSTFASSAQSSLIIRGAPPIIISLTASDPDAGDGIFGNGDVFTVGFDVQTNRPPVATKAELENLFFFLQSLGADFTGTWASASSLEITIVDSTGGAPTLGPGGLTLTLLAGGNLKTADGTSFAATGTSPEAIGSLGDKIGPSVTDFTASDPDDDDSIFNAGDRLTFRFSEDTNTPPVASQSDVDKIFDFTPALEATYSGVFVNLRTLVVTIDSVPMGATPPEPGTFFATIKASGELTSTPPFSLASQGDTPPLGGTFGERAGPFIVSLTAEDPDGGDAIYGAGDTITGIYSEETSEPPVDTKTDLDKIFDYNQVLGIDYSGSWLDPVTLVITIDVPLLPGPTIDDDGVDDGELRLTMKASGGLQDDELLSSFSQGNSPLLIGDFGTKEGPSVVSFLVSDPDSGDGIFGDGDEFTVGFDGPTNRPPAATKANLENLFDFSESLGTDLVGSWTSASVLTITVVDSIGGAPIIGPGGTTLTVLPGGNLKDGQSTTLPSESVFGPLTGSFGDRIGPSITSFLAADPNNDDAIYDVGDTLTMRFDVDVDTSIPVGTKADLDALFTASQEMGDDYSGAFTNARTLVITIDDAQFLPAPPQIDVLVLTINKLAGFTSAAPFSLPSTASTSALGGTFGNKLGPEIVSLVARDPFGNDAVYGKGDTITVSFDVSTSGPELFGSPVTLSEAINVFFIK